MDKLGGMDGVWRLLCGKATIFELPEPEPFEQEFFCEENGVIYFPVLSDGTTGPEWIKRLACKGCRLDKYAKWLLHSSNFKPTSGVVYEIAILKGTLFKDDSVSVKEVCTEAKRRGFVTPNAEVVCLIREKFSDRGVSAMGLEWLFIMHKPINVDGRLRFLVMPQYSDNIMRLIGCCYNNYDGSDSTWANTGGFAFCRSRCRS